MPTGYIKFSRMKKWGRVIQQCSYIFLRENAVSPHWSSKIQANRGVPLVIFLTAELQVCSCSLKPNAAKVYQWILELSQRQWDTTVHLIRSWKMQFWLWKVFLMVEYQHCQSVFPFSTDKKKKCFETGTLKHNVLSHWPPNLTLTKCSVTTWRYWNMFFLGNVGQQRERFRSFLELQIILNYLGILKHILNKSFSFCRSVKLLQQLLTICKFKVICNLKFKSMAYMAHNLLRFTYHCSPVLKKYL